MSSHSTQTPTLTDYVNASNPLLLLRTYEYDRVLGEILPDLFGESDVPVSVFSWNPSVDNKVVYEDTFHATDNKVGIHAKLQISRNHTLAAWLAEVATYDINVLRRNPLVLIVYNPDLAAISMSDTSSRDASMFYPMIMEVAKKFRCANSHIFWVGTSAHIPAELTELLTVVDVPLPTHKELDTFFRGILKNFKANKVPCRLPKTKEEVSKLVSDAANAAMGLGYHGAEAALALSVAMYSGVDIPTIHSQKAAKVSESDVLTLVHTTESEETVAGFSSYIKWLNQRKDFFSDEARAFKLPYPKGVLIVGTPGTGKSTAAKMTATHLGLPLLRLDMGSVYRSLLGASEAAFDLALRTIEAVSPCTCWLDEIEKSLPKTSGESDGGVSERIMAKLLHWRQETPYPVFFVATANDIDSLPPMLYRRGRFDKVWGVGLPNEATRKEIFKIHLKKFDKELRDDALNKAVKRTVGASGAEIQAIISDAMFLAFADDRILKYEHISEALDGFVPLSKSHPAMMHSYENWAESFSVSNVY